jgi:phospholipid/cholesterol/gamma-HCH transport system substrate-binding protein
VNISKEAKVAILLIASIVVFVLGFNFLKGSRFASVDPIYYALFDNAEGLYKSSKIYINGVQVGSVKEIEFENAEKLGKIKLTLQLNGNYPIPQGSKAVLYSNDLFGNKALKIEMGKEKALYKKGDYIEGINDMGMMGAISDKISPLATDADKVMTNLNTLFDRQQQENIYKSINSLNKVLITLDKTVNNVNGLLEKNDKTITKSLDNVASITSNIEKKNNEISTMIANLSQVSGQMKEADIAKTVNNLNKSIDELNKLLVSINDGGGTLSKLIKDPTMHNKLVETISATNALMTDLKANPKRYVHFSVFGKKQ